MKQELYVIKPKHVSDTLSKMIDAACEGWPDIQHIDLLDLPELRSTRLLIALELDQAGYCIPVLEVISKLYQRGKDALSGTAAVLLLHSPNDFNTKSTAADVIFQLNQLGCAFPGHPAVEAIEGLGNFRTWQKTMQLPLIDICLEHCRRLGSRLLELQHHQIAHPQLTALHSSSHHTSNTLALWRMVADGLSCCHIQELHVENGEIPDCKGCSFTTCTHYSKQSSCFYGGAMVAEVYPAIEASDAVIWLCPNYNDAVSANLCAVINRLTALYRKTSFYNKALYAVIVSGNSGSDSVAMQLIGALCINKGFYLPPYFCITAIANDPDSVHQIQGIEKQAAEFASNMLEELVIPGH